MKKQNGFTMIEVALVLAVVIVIGLVAYNVITRVSGDPGSSQVTTTVPEVGIAEAPEIKSANDLDVALNTLDEINLDDNTELNQLEEELAQF